MPWAPFLKGFVFCTCLVQALLFLLSQYSGVYRISVRDVHFKNVWDSSILNNQDLTEQRTDILIQLFSWRGAYVSNLREPSQTLTSLLKF